MNCTIFFKTHVFLLKLFLLGARSLKCDLESQLLIVTNNKKLQQNFQTEKCDIFKSTSLYAPEGDILKSPFWVRFVLKIFKNYF